MEIKAQYPELRVLFDSTSEIKSWGNSGLVQKWIERDGLPLCRPRIFGIEGLGDFETEGTGGGGGGLCGEAIGNIANAQSRKMWRRGFIPEDRGIPEEELLVAFFAAFRYGLIIESYCGKEGASILCLGMIFSL